MLAIALATLKRVPLEVYAGLVLLLASVGLYHEHTLAVANARRAGADFTRDSITTATRQQLDSLSGVRRERETAHTTATVAMNHVLRRVPVDTAAANAATAGLMAAQTALSTLAQADTTVQVLTARGEALVTATRQLTADLDSVGRAALTERAAAASLHAADTSAIRGLATTTVVVRDSLHVEQAKPKRTWRSTLASATVGAVLASTAFVVTHVVRP
jgi:hypothetical protein